MMAAGSPSGRAALAAYGAAPRGDRLHVRVRWSTCPIAAVERRVPWSGTVLDIGCGHGLVSLYLALCSPHRVVTGVDIDAHKVVLARAAAQAAAVEQVTFEVVSPGELPDGVWDTIVITDVVYLLEPAARRALLEEAAGRLAPGGRLLLKETDTSPRWKYTIAKAQELVSTRVLGITAGDTVDYASSAELAGLLVELGLETQVERLDAAYLHPHVLVSGHRPQ